LLIIDKEAPTLVEIGKSVADPVVELIGITLGDTLTDEAPPVAADNLKWNNLPAEDKAEGKVTVKLVVPSRIYVSTESDTEKLAVCVTPLIKFNLTTEGFKIRLFKS
jgi:hypothetical protein